MNFLDYLKNPAVARNLVTSLPGFSALKTLGAVTDAYDNIKKNKAARSLDIPKPAVASAQQQLAAPQQQTRQLPEASSSTSSFPQLSINMPSGTPTGAGLSAASAAFPTSQGVQQAQPANDMSALIKSMLQEEQTRQKRMRDLYGMQTGFEQRALDTVKAPTEERLRVLGPQQQAALRNLDSGTLNDLLAQTEAELRTQQAQRETLLGFLQEQRATEAAQQKGTGPIEISPGATLYDPITGQPVYTAPTAGSQKVATTPETAAQQTADVVSLVDELFNDTATLGNVVGPISSKLPTLRGKSADFENKVNQLKSILTLTVIPQMKGFGVLSDRDIQILQSSATSLNTNMSETGFKQELQRIREKVLQGTPSFTTGGQQNIQGETDVSRLRSEFQRLFPNDSFEQQLQRIGPDAIRGILEDQGATFTSDLSMSQNGSTLDKFKQSIIKQESGGNYKAIGAKTKYGEALGKYQIIPQFHFAKIGLKDTPADKQRFLNSPELQDKLFGIIIDGLVKQYNGDLAKVAAAYYGGGGGASVVGTTAGNKRQVIGGREHPSINQYVQSVLSRVS